MTPGDLANLPEAEKCLIRACEPANRDLDVAAIEQEWDSLQDRVEEPWQDAEARRVQLDPSQGSEIAKTRPCVIQRLDRLSRDDLAALEQAVQQVLRLI